MKIIQLLAIVLFSICLIAYFLDWSWFSSSIIGATVGPSLLYFLQRSELKKCFIEIQPHSIRWKLMQDEQPKIISLETADPGIESNWMGLIIYDGSKKHTISLDGVKNKDRKRIFKKLSNYYKVSHSAALC